VLSVNKSRSDINNFWKRPWPRIEPRPAGRERWHPVEQRAQWKQWWLWGCTCRRWPAWRWGRCRSTRGRRSSKATRTGRTFSLRPLLGGLFSSECQKYFSYLLLRTLLQMTALVKFGHIVDWLRNPITIGIFIIWLNVTLYMSYEKLFILLSYRHSKIFNCCPWTCLTSHRCFNYS